MWYTLLNNLIREQEKDLVSVSPRQADPTVQRIKRLRNLRALEGVVNLIEL